MSGRPAGRLDITRGKVSPPALLAAGALLLPAFLFQQDPGIRAVQVVLFTVLNALSGRRIRIIQILVVSAGIVLFNLVIPTGRVLATVLGFPLTETALRSGLLKSTAVVGMIGISQFALRGTLRIPGRVGGLLGRSLSFFERVTSLRGRIDRKNIIASIDALLFEVHDPRLDSGTDLQDDPSPTTIRTSPLAGLLLGLLVAANWAVLAWTVLRPHPFW